MPRLLLLIFTLLLSSIAEAENILALNNSLSEKCASTNMSAQYAMTTKGDYYAGYRELGELPNLWQPITFPYTLPRQVNQQAKPNQVVTHWIRLDIDSKFKECFKATVEPLALFIPRWQTIGTLKVYADHRLIFASDSGPVWNGYNYPLRIEFKQFADLPQKIVLRIDSLQTAGLGISSIYFQSSKSLTRTYFTRLWAQTKLPELASSAFLIIGVLL